MEQFPKDGKMIVVCVRKRKPLFIIVSNFKKPSQNIIILPFLFFANEIWFSSVNYH